MNDSKKKKKDFLSTLADELKMIKNKGLSKPAAAAGNRDLKSSSRGNKPKFKGK